jgi:hypothetical protein
MKRIYHLFILSFLLYSCEQPFEIEIQADTDRIVVEGFIEASVRNLPPVVILTQSRPFFQEINTEELDDLFVRDAIVKIKTSTTEITLQEICYSELPPNLQSQFSELAGLEAMEIPFDFCLYTDLVGGTTGQEGESYELLVEAQGQSLKATTTIPYGVPLDSLWFVPAPGIPTDTLVQLRGIVSDPPNTANFYRYFTQTTGAMLPGFPSVTDDRLFDGVSFEFPIPKGESRNVVIDPSVYGLFPTDTPVTIRWTCMDEVHFNFWNTLEFNAANQGPFSSYTQIDTNIEGGLGVWGGYVGYYYEL